MASIPQKQISDAYYECNRDPGEWIYFGRGYRMMYNNYIYKLVHYDTEICQINEKTKKIKVDGYSVSDVMAINSLLYHVSPKKRVYSANGRIYLEGEGPRYQKKRKDATMHPFGL